MKQVLVSPCCPESPDRTRHYPAMVYVLPTPLPGVTVGSVVVIPRCHALKIAHITYDLTVEPPLQRLLVTGLEGVGAEHFPEGFQWDESLEVAPAEERNPSELLHDAIDQDFLEDLETEITVLARNHDRVAKAYAQSQRAAAFIARWVTGTKSDWRDILPALLQAVPDSKVLQSRVAPLTPRDEANRGRELARFLNGKTRGRR